MIPRDLIGFGRACEEFAPPEIRITGRHEWGAFTAENDSRAPQWLCLVRTCGKVKYLFQVRGIEPVHQRLEERGNAPRHICQLQLEIPPTTTRIKWEFIGLEPTQLA